MIRSLMKNLECYCLMFLATQIYSAEITGWRGNGMGCYPNAEPPTEWGPDKNIIWSTNLPSWGNATPVIVGDRIFITSEPTDLLCLQRSDGKILWQARNTYFEPLTPEEIEKAKEMQRQAAVVRAEIAEVEKQRAAVQKEVNRINDLRKRIQDLEKLKALFTNPEALANRIKELEKQEADTASSLAKTPNDGRLKKQAEQIGSELKFLRDENSLKAELEKTQQVLAAEQAHEAELKKQLADLSSQIEEMKKNKLAPLEKYDMPATHNVTGYATPTVVSDGKHVFFLGGHGMAACYSLDGQRKWIKFIAKSTDGYGHSASPVLAGGYLVVQMTGLTALNPETGEEVWKAPDAVRRWGTPVVVKVSGEDVLVTPNGDFVRAADGAVLARKLAKLEYASPIVKDGIAYFIEEGGKAVKIPEAFTPPFKPQVLWNTGKIPGDRYYASAAISEGLIYAINQQGHLV
ncbi:MAG: PQQ-binding-like beta-propeller repeat protein, partial [Kiritimatiellae bacterium]|nr:PQQ-binding-like beta-propeller repeat protein [Kiritimatiellia bacterium]